MHCNDSCHGAVYLALSLPPVEFPTRKTLDYWLPVALVRWPRLRHVVETGTILCISLLLALLFPSSSAKVRFVRHGCPWSAHGHTQDSAQAGSGLANLPMGNI